MKWKKLHVFSFFFLLVFQPMLSQTKEIKGDTSHWSGVSINLLEKEELKDFLKSDDEFNFRFWTHGQVVEISKNKGKIEGLIINYVFQRNRNVLDTFSNKVVLSTEQSENLYTLIQNTRISEIPTDSEIESWQHGFDGINYTLEFADKKSYEKKSYWTPIIQDSVPEAKIVASFIENLIETVNLSEVYGAFLDTLPKAGCYSNESVITLKCFPSNYFIELGYSGAIKLPNGFYASLTSTIMRNIPINSTVSIQYNFDNNGYHHLNIQAQKWRLFYRKRTLSDFARYTYQNRILNIPDAVNQFENHQIVYGLNFNNSIGIGVGLDYLSKDLNLMGASATAFKYFSSINLTTYVSTSFFKEQVNLKAEVFKEHFFNNSSSVLKLSYGLTYQKFMGYEDLYFGFRFMF